jgi:hypothetical protein
MTQPQIPPQLRVWQFGVGFANTAVLHALVKAGVIEQLRDQPKRLPELAQTCRLNADVLYRTLRFATVIEVVTLDGEHYALTDVGRLLLKDVPGSIYMAVLFIGEDPWQNAWRNFAHALTTGDNAFEPVMGAGFFDYLDQHPEYGAPFNQWQTILTTMTARAITEAYDFTPFGTLCDIGGGQGILLKSILTANPHLRGVLYDQKNVVKEHLLADLAERVEIQSGNFFERVPAADLLLMKNVLHDWSDEKCQVILRQCRQAMQPSTRLLIVEMVIASPLDLMGAFYDLHMQVMLGGKERTEDEFRLLLQRASLKLHRIIPTKSPMKIIEASL